jgi:hypothetical protein
MQRMQRCEVLHPHACRVYSLHCMPCTCVELVDAPLALPSSLHATTAKRVRISMAFIDDAGCVACNRLHGWHNTTGAHKLCVLWITAAGCCVLLSGTHDAQSGGIAADEEYVRLGFAGQLPILCLTGLAADSPQSNWQGLWLCTR